ncbi:hypothetical protein L1049_008807 [Liquidambar formosana]|uniref:Glycosyltransferase n=1 Tax=Liquidambar formosana TaxID=63359 RepID=A0AAP0X2J5_LIQFO
MEQPNPSIFPHAVILPMPAQGHMKPMLRLAELLCLAGLHVTFVNSDYIQARLLKSMDVAAFCSRLPGFRFESLSDGLPPEHPRAGRLANDLFFSTRSVTKPLFRELLISLGKESGSPPTCVIADGLMSFAVDAAEEVGIPIITFRTYNASCTWVYFHISKLIEEGEIPFQGDKDMDRQITCIPGLESLLRRRDLPGICRLEEIENPVMQYYLSETSAMTRASALIINTFEELEAPVISKLGSLFPKVYTIGPLHTFLKSHIKHSSSPSVSSNGSLWQQDRSCLAWLDSQPSKSVVYVSFGSLVSLTRDQMMEFWYGLVHSGKKFLWVIRPNSIEGEEGVGQTPVEELLEGTKERGFMVGWAPQEEVLGHPSIGGFITHSGWNSTLESLSAGVPVICWPQFSDQLVNSRCVSELWRIGLDMKDTCDRLTIEKMVRDLLEDKREEIIRSANEIARMARESVKEGGSSYCNLEKLINDIRLMCLTN